MAAQSLPLETLYQIFGYINGSLAPYASVCRIWQSAVEKLTFADLNINSSILEEFDQITGSSKSLGRYYHIKKIFFKVVLPKYSVAARSRYENEHDRNRNNEAFTRAIESLFRILSSWPNECCNTKYLELYSRSPSDWQAEPDWGKRAARQKTGCIFPERDLLERRYEHCYLGLIEESNLSNVDCISSFRIPGQYSHRKIAPKAVSKMVSHLPRLQHINVALNDCESEDIMLRDQLRNDFTFNDWPQSLRHLNLSYWGPTPRDQSLPPPKRSSTGMDSLSIALNQLSQQLESIKLSHIMISSELFWPAGAGKSILFWPNLVAFDLSYEAATSCGKWLFERDPAWNDKCTESSCHFDSPQSCNEFRMLPNKHINDIYLAAAYAAKNMPRLNRMRLEAEIRSSVPHEPNPVPTHIFQYDVTLGKAIWVSSSEFHIAEEVRRAWNTVAKSHGHVEICAESTWFHKLEFADYSPAELFEENWRKEHECFSWVD